MVFSIFYSHFRTFYTKLNSVLDEIAEDLLSFKQSINATESTPYVMKPEFEQFAYTLPIQCEPCYSTEDALPLIDIIKDKALEHLDAIEDEIVEIKDNVTKIYSAFLDALTANSVADINAILQDDIPQVLEISMAIRDILHENITLMVDEALTKVERFDDYMKLQCRDISYDTQSNQASLLYDRLVSQMLKKTTDQLIGFDEKMRHYVFGNRTLEEVAIYSRDMQNGGYLPDMEALTIEAQEQYNSLYLQVSSSFNIIITSHICI